MVDGPPMAEASGRRPALRRARRRRPRSASPAACAPGGSAAARPSSISATRATRCSSSMSGSIKIMLPADTGDEAILATLRAGRLLRRAGPARRGAALGDGGRDRADRDLDPAARPVPRADRDRAGDARGAPRDARRGGPAPHQPRRGAPLPRHHRAPRVAPRPPRRRDRATPLADGAIRLAGAADPGRPRGDDRLHPPEREQAARDVHRRRADPARARPDRHPRPRRAEPTDRPDARPRSAGDPRVRRGAIRRAGSPSRRMWAAASAARSRPFAPPRNATRRSRWTQSGPTTTTVTAVSRAARPRPDARARRRRRRLAAVPGERLEPFGRAGRRARCGRVAGGASASGGGPPRRVLGERLGQSQPRDVAEERRERCRRSRPRRPPASSRAPRAPPRSPPPRSSRPRPRRGRRGGPGPSVAASTATSRRPRSPSPARRRDPDVDGVGPGVRRDDRVRSPGAAPRRAGPRPATRRSPPAGSVRLAVVRAGAARRGAAAGPTRLPHRAHLARRPGQRDDDPAVGPVDPPAGRRPVRVRQRRRRRDEPGLLEVHRRERHPAPRPELAQPAPRGPGRPPAPRRRPPRSPRGSGRPASGRGRRSRRRGRPGRARSANASRTASSSSGRAWIRRDRDAEPGQAPGELAGVRVARLADGQLACRCSAARRSGCGRGGAMLRSLPHGRSARSRDEHGIPAEVPSDASSRNLCPVPRAAGRDRPSSHRLPSVAASAARRPMTDIEQSGFSEFDRLARARPPDARAARRRDRRGRAARPAAPTTSPTGPCPTSRASRPGSSAGSGPTRPASRSCGTSCGLAGATRVEPAMTDAERRAAAAEAAAGGAARRSRRRRPRDPRRRAVEPRGARPRPARARAAAARSPTPRSATRRAAGPTPTSPGRADPRSSPAGSRSSSDSSGGPRPADAPIRPTPGSAAPTGSSTPPTSWAAPRCEERPDRPADCDVAAARGGLGRVAVATASAGIIPGPT